VASLKELKGRINSVKSTQKITKAKQMVAAAEAAQGAGLGRGRAALCPAAGRGRGEPRHQGLARRTRCRAAGRHRQRPEAPAGGRQLDKGLAGAFNSNIVRGRARQGERAQGRGQGRRFLPGRPQGPRADRRAYPSNIAQMFDTTAVREPGYAEPSGSSPS
jgi:F-type H+-transporting ATPase subunit gamma